MSLTVYIDSTYASCLLSCNEDLKPEIVVFKLKAVAAKKEIKFLENDSF